MSRIALRSGPGLSKLWPGEAGASPAVVEQVYRAMISAFIAEELNVHATLTATDPAGNA